jgi:hypothetical protein
MSVIWLGTISGIVPSTLPDISRRKAAGNAGLMSPSEEKAGSAEFIILPFWGEYQSQAKLRAKIWLSISLTDGLTKWVVWKAYDDGMILENRRGWGVPIVSDVLTHSFRTSEPGFGATVEVSFCSNSANNTAASSISRQNS